MSSIIACQERLKQIKKEYGAISLGDTTVDMVDYSWLLNDYVEWKP